jgi:hypothetical protein
LLEKPILLDFDSNKILKYGQLFTAKIKKSFLWMRSFEDIFGSEDELIADIQAENWKKTLRSLFQFTIENLSEIKDGNSTPSPIKGNTNIPEIVISNESGTVKNEDLVKIYTKSDSLAQNISMHKNKIQKIYESLKESVDISRGILDGSRTTPTRKWGNSSTPGIERMEFDRIEGDEKRRMARRGSKND